MASTRFRQNFSLAQKTTMKPSRVRKFCDGTSDNCPGDANDLQFVDLPPLPRDAGRLRAGVDTDRAVDARRSGEVREHGGAGTGTGPGDRDHSTGSPTAYGPGHVRLPSLVRTTVGSMAARGGRW